MNRTIAQYLKERITTKHYAEVVAGIVTPVKVTRAGKIVTYAVDCGVEGQDCDDNGSNPQLQLLVPDKEKKSIFYFEDPSGVELVKVEGQWRHMRCTLILVGWLNLNALGLPSSDGCSGCTWSYRIYSDILKLLPKPGSNIGTDCPLVDVNVEFKRQLPRNSEVFTRYTFGEERLQFRLPPYDCFAIELSCTWRVNEKCIADIPQNDPITC